MQTITREQLVEKAVSLLANGTVSAVMGWQKGEFDYDVTPAVFATEEEIKNNFLFNDFTLFAHQFIISNMLFALTNCTATF